jgi:NAD(P)-dependent dehydrogenase (short-subunit alcohol dehydrogenase family)
MSESLYIITGASRGLGAAMADALVQPGHRLLCMARQERSELAQQARDRGVPCEQWRVDLADPQPAAERLAAWLGSQAGSGLTRACLINNAGVLSRIGPVDEADFADLSNALRVGLEATLLLSAAFVRGTRDWAIDRRIMNISSGLGRRAMAGSASYCAAKAGMDHLSRAMALDEAQRAHGARVVSIAPGVIDTDMQTQLRESDPHGFPDRGNFVNLKRSGSLTTPAATAEKLLAYLHRADYGQQAIADIREA